MCRHWPFFQRQEADALYVITTEDKECVVPQGALALRIGKDSYILGEHLPKRLVNTLYQMLERPWDALILAEYDTLIFNSIDLKKLNGVASHKTGTFNDMYSYYHNPVGIRPGNCCGICGGRDKDN